MLVLGSEQGAGPRLSGAYEGQLAAGGAQIAGEWKQNGASLPLTLTRAGKLPVLRRPQEPKKPYPYREEEVAYDNKQGHSHMGGTLTLPCMGGPFPAALLIAGSGQHNRDEALMGHRPFLVLADYLTRRGIAVLRVDSRGVGGSTGDVAHATTADFGGDVLAGVVYLKASLQSLLSPWFRYFLTYDPRPALKKVAQSTGAPDFLVHLVAVSLRGSDCITSPAPSW